MKYEIQKFLSFVCKRKDQRKIEFFLKRMEKHKYYILLIPFLLKKSCCTDHLSKGFNLKLRKCYWVSPGSNKPKITRNGHLILKYISCKTGWFKAFPRNVYVWLSLKIAVYLWKSGGNFSWLITCRKYYDRLKSSLGHKDLGVSRKTYILNHIEI